MVVFLLFVGTMPGMVRSEENCGDALCICGMLPHGGQQRNSHTEHGANSWSNLEKVLPPALSGMLQKGKKKQFSELVPTLLPSYGVLASFSSQNKKMGTSFSSDCTLQQYWLTKKY